MTTTLEPGVVIDGKYRLVRRIGEGGMGTVFEGENVRIKRKVAIKVLHEHVATSPEYAQRFVREARASARIGSDHICDVLDLGDLENGEKYIVMELLDGESLEARLERDIKIESTVLVPILFEVLEGLGAMHNVGVIHRDLKPANIFLCRRPGGKVSVKILDFGVAKVEATEDDPSGVVDMTTTGTMMGTPLYMSPEQARGARDVDGRTDLYAASVIAYHALTGRTPHEGVSLHELLFKIVLDDPKPIKELAPEVDDELAEIVTHGLNRDPDNRYKSAREYQEALVAWGTPRDLSLVITLPSSPPPLRNQTGGFPKAIIEAAGEAIRTGNTPIGRPTGPPTPVSATADTQPSRPPNEPLARLPIMGHLRESEPKQKAAGDTLLAGSEPAPPAKSAPPPPSRGLTPAPVAASKAPAPSSSKNTIIIGIIVAVLAAIIGLKLGSADKGPEPTPPTPASSLPAPPPPPAPEPITTTSAAPEPLDAAIVDAGTTTAVPFVPHPILVPPPPAKVDAAAVPAPPPNVSGRTFRTDAGF